MFIWKENEKETSIFEQIFKGTYWHMRHVFRLFIDNWWKIYNCLSFESYKQIKFHYSPSVIIHRTWINVWNVYSVSTYNFTYHQRVASADCNNFARVIYWMYMLWQLLTHTPSSHRLIFYAPLFSNLVHTNKAYTEQWKEFLTLFIDELYWLNPACSKTVTALRKAWCQRPILGLL